MAPPHSCAGSLFKARIGRVSPEEMLQQCKRMLTEITDGITATAATTAAGTTTARGSRCGHAADDVNCNNNSSMENNLLETTMQLYEVLSEKDKRKHTETLAIFKNRNHRNYGTNRKRLRADDGPASTQETRGELWEHIQRMQTEITDGITAAAAGTTAKEVTAVSRSHDTASRSTTGGNEYNLDSTTLQLDAILSAQQKRNHPELLVASTTSTNHKEETEDCISARRTNRTRLRADDDDPATTKLQFPTSILINYVLPYLDHATWKSMSMLSTGIHGLIQQMQLFPPWPTTHGITVQFNKEGGYTRYLDFLLSFDYTNGSRLVVWSQNKGCGFIFDSRRGFIKELHCGVIKEREKACASKVYLLDKTTLLVKFTRKDGVHSLYLYRFVDDESSPRNTVGIDMIRHSTITTWSGPWIFKRNGILYVATAQGGVDLHKFGDGKSESIVIYQYLGDTTWPGCLIETHRLQHPEIDYDDDDDDNDDDDEPNYEYCREEVFEYIGQPAKDKQYNTTDERIVFVSVTNKGNLHVHCWCVTFEDQKVRTGIKNSNHDGKPVPCISLGTTPNLQLGFLHHKKHEAIKIVPWPKKDNHNYVFRIIQFLDTWWQEYEEDAESFKVNGAPHLKPRPNTFDEFISTYNKGGIFVSDYNILTNRFDNTNYLSLKNRDQSVLQYNDVLVSHDGGHLLSHSQRQNYFGIHHIDALGCSLVKNFEFESITGKISVADYHTIYLSNNSKIIGIPIFRGREEGPDRFHIGYLYLN